MTIFTADAQAPDSDDDLKRALIAQCRLTDEQVNQITEEMQRLQLPFPQAAVRLGIVTINETERAREWSDQMGDLGGSSLIETALRRHQQSSRREIVTHSVEVKPGSALILAHDHDNPRSEQLRALRTQLLLLCEGYNQGHSIAIISPDISEGRSQLTAELAIAFSQLGRRTLLVDADLRKPKQHILFNAENTWGLAQALSVGGEPRTYSVEGLPKLRLLTAGPPVQNPLELLSDSRFEALMFDWRKSYDFILLDTPALSRFSDGLTVSRAAARVLVLCRANMTEHSVMKEMLRKLTTTRTVVLGAVVNSF
jgi:receptor protein-tyrosine kinase